MSRETDATRATRLTARGVVHISGIRQVTAAQVRNDGATDTDGAATPTVRDVSTMAIYGVSSYGGGDKYG